MEVLAATIPDRSTGKVVVYGQVHSRLLHSLVHAELEKCEVVILSMRHNGTIARLS